MTKQQVIELIQLALGGTTDATKQLAEALLAKSVLKIARQAGVEFRREWEPFALESSKADYIIGKDILKNWPSTWNMQELWRTDVPNWPIPIKNVGDYSDEALGRTGNGPPTVATIAGSPATLTLYPTPDSNYPVRALVQRRINGIDDIPDEYHDILVDQAYMFIAASRNPEVVAMLLKGDYKELASDGLAGWSGSVIPFEMAPGLETNVGHDSHNLR